MDSSHGEPVLSKLLNEVRGLKDEVRELKRAIMALTVTQDEQGCVGLQILQQVRHLLLSRTENERFYKMNIRNVVDLLSRVLKKFDSDQVPQQALGDQLTEQRGQWLLRRPAT